ncbi:MAG: Gfo/Idh/MocA family protein, partial [Planctomycetota bacterium]
GVSFWVAGGLRAQESKSPNEQIAMASVGIDGKGASDSKDAARAGNMVAICDVDEQKLEAAGRAFPGAKPYSDFRKMFEEMGDKIDAVTVSTPDHMHGAVALMAMRMGKHCFCQKPLTRTIYEARLMAKVAAETGVATQMGNQGTANDSLRHAAAALRKGVVGNAKEVHVWTNRPIWPQGIERAAPLEVPSFLHWDLWLGVAPERPYADGYHPFKWRGWWDFGSGALGDMACHTVNMPYMGLDLKNPTSVQATTSGHNRDSYPAWSKIAFEFPAVDWRPAVKFFWYDGGQRPPAELYDEMVSTYEKAGVLGGGEEEAPKGDKADKKKQKKKKAQDPRSMFRSGCIVVGEKGNLYSPGDYAEKKILLTGGQDLPEVEYERSPGHFEEWVMAIKGGPQARSNMPNYSGGLTETILLGNLAVFAANEPETEGPKVEWDAVNLVPTNMPELMAVVKPTYRDGYVLE